MLCINCSLINFISGSISFYIIINQQIENVNNIKQLNEIQDLNVNIYESFNQQHHSLQNTLSNKNKENNSLNQLKRILIWTGFQRADDSIYTKLFQRIKDGKCPSRNICHITRDRKLLNESDAVLFFLPNLHWEKYDLPKQRDLEVPWILGAYESTLSILDRAG